MKFPKLFGRKSKKSDDYDDEFDDDLDDAPEETPSRGDDDESVDEDELVGGGDYDDDDDDEFDGSSGRSSRRMLFVIGGVGLAVVLIVSGGAWWFFGESGEPATAHEEAPAAKTTATHVVLEVAPRPTEKPAAPAKPAPGGKMSATDTLNAMAALSTGPGAGIVVKPIQDAVFSGTEPAPKAEALAPAPDPELVEQSPVGPLPKVSDGGRMPWQVYARPFQATEGTPLISIIFTGLGMNKATSEAAITYLPAAVTFAIDPYGTSIGDLDGGGAQGRP